MADETVTTDTVVPAGHTVGTTGAMNEADVTAMATGPTGVALVAMTQLMETPLPCQRIARRRRDALLRMSARRRQGSLV